MDRPEPPRRTRAPWRVRLRVLWNRLIDWVWPDRPTTWPGIWAQVRPHVSTILRMTAATVISYAIIHALYPDQRDLTGALTALLVVQASSAGTLKMGLVRMGAVMTGIFIAVGVASLVGLTWWSLGIVVALALSVATLLRLTDQLAEAPISAMLILGSTAVSQAADTRLLLTLIGAAVGMAFGLVAPPSLPISLATSRVRQFADQLADVLSEAGESLAVGSISRRGLESRITTLREMNPLLTTGYETIDEVSQGRRFNTRALGTADVGPLLRSGLSTLEDCQLAVRSLFVQLRREFPETPSAGPYDDELRAVFAVVLQHASESIRSFGALVDAEASERPDEASARFAMSVEMLREAKAILTELMMTSSGQTWLLRGSVLAAVEQVLDQLNLESRSKVHQEWQAEQDRRIGAHLPVLVRNALPQPERPLPKLIERGLVEAVRGESGLVSGSRRVFRRGRKLFGPDLSSLRNELNASMNRALEQDEWVRRHSEDQDPSENRRRSTRPDHDDD